MEMARRIFSTGSPPEQQKLTDGDYALVQLTDSRRYFICRMNKLKYRGERIKDEVLYIDNRYYMAEILQIGKLTIVTKNRTLLQRNQLSVDALKTSNDLENKIRQISKQNARKEERRRKMAAFLSTPELRFYNSSNLNSLRSSSISLRNLRRHKNSARMTLSSLQLNVPDNKIMRVNSMDSRQFRRITNCKYWRKHTKSSELISSSSKCKTKLIPDILISDYSTSNLRDNSKSHSMAMEHSYSVDPEEHSPLPRITQRLEPCIQNNYESIINSADSKDSISDFDTVEQQMQNSVALSTSNSASIEQDTPYFSDPEKQFLTFEDSEKPKSKFIPNGKIESKGRNTFDANLENLNEVKANFKSKEQSTRNIVNGMKVPVYFTSMKDLSQHLLSQNKTHLVRTGSLQILPFINIESIKNCSNTSPKSENIHLKINVELQPISRFHRFLAALLCFFNVIPMMQRLERFVRWLFKLPPRSGTSFKSVGLCDASTASAEEFERKNNDVVRKKSGEDERLINTCRMPKLFQFTPSRSIFWRTR